MARYQVTVRVKALYEIEADSTQEAREEALSLAGDGFTPDEVEYDGDGVEAVTRVG